MAKRRSKGRSRNPNLQRMYGYFWCRDNHEKMKHERKWQSAHVYCRPRTPQEPKINEEGKWTAAYGQKCGRCKTVCFPYRVEYIQCSVYGSTENCGCCVRCRNVKEDCTCCPKCRRKRKKCTCCKVCHHVRGKCTCCVHCKRLPGLCVCQFGEDGELVYTPGPPPQNIDDITEPDVPDEDRKANSRRPHLRDHCMKCLGGDPC